MYIQPAKATMRLFLTFTFFCIFYNKIYGETSLEIDIMLKTLNKPPLKTIKSKDGDIIDCVDIYKQPAFDHPGLTNHKIQMKPSIEFASKETTSIQNNSSSEPIASQTWSKSGSCPAGTIPVRRVTRDDIKRASSPSQFGKKTYHRYNILDESGKRRSNFNLTAANIRDPRPKNRSEAFALTVGFNYLGAQSDINVWNPPGVEAGDYSTGQIWLLAGLSGEFESIEAGWMVNPNVYGDSQSRLFIYWTKDAYGKTGCLDLLCSGFVQTTHELALGSALTPVSTHTHQFYMTASIFLDPTTRNWWLTANDIVIGYWPGNLFAYLRHSATAVQWGGEVYSPNVKKKPHTKTPMESGEWASHLWGNACFHTNLRIKDYSLQLKYPQILSEFCDEYDCYSTMLHRETYKSEPLFFFGGPGKNLRCP